MIKIKSVLIDSTGLLSCLNFKKVINIFLLGVSYLISRFKLVPIQKGSPYAMSIEVTTSCNLHCTECPSGLRKFTRPTGRIDLDFYRQIIDQVKGYLVYLNHSFILNSSTWFAMLMIMGFIPLLLLTVIF